MIASQAPERHQPLRMALVPLPAGWTYLLHLHGMSTSFWQPAVSLLSQLFIFFSLYKDRSNKGERRNYRVNAIKNAVTLEDSVLVSTAQ